MRKVLVFLAMAALLAVAAGCGGSSSSDSGSSSKPIKLMMAAALTGGGADFGNHYCQGAKLAAADINAAGGIAKGPHEGAKVEIDCVDDQGSPQAASTLATKYASDTDTWAMFGFITSGEAQAAAVVAERYKLAIIGAKVGADFLTTQVHNVVVLNPRLESDGFAAVDFCKQYYGGSTLGEISSDLSYVHSYDAGLLTALSDPSIGVTQSVTKIFPYGAVKDFSPQLTAIKQADPDCTVVGDFPPEQCTIIAQGRSLGLTTAFLDYEASGVQPSCIKAAGKAWVGTAWWQDVPPTDSNPLLAKVANSYQAKHGEPMESYAIYAYDAVLAVKYALEDGAKTRTDLLSYLGKIDGPGLAGRLQFGPNLRPLERFLTITEATGTGVEDQKIVARYKQNPDGTATRIFVKKCADSATCQTKLVGAKS